MKTARTPLHRDRIVRAAVALADRDGLDNLSMRKLAAALGVEAMSLYNHVGSVADLHAAMLDQILTEEPPHAYALDTDAESTLVEVATRFRRLAQRHPFAVTLMTRVDAHSTVVRDQVAEAVALLRECGLSADASVIAYQTLMSFALGFVFQEQRGILGMTCCDADWPSSSSAARPDGVDAAFGLGVRATIAGLSTLQDSHQTRLFSEDLTDETLVAPRGR